MNIKRSVKDFYETFDFEEMITGAPALIQEFLDGEIEFIKKHISPKKYVLEIGCGYGRLLKILSPISKKVAGIDFSKRMTRLARKNLKNYKNVDPLLMNADNLTFNDELFDYVVCLDNSFGNMPNIELNVIKEMVRVCKKGGEIIISVFSDNAKTVQLENYLRIGLKNIRDNGTAIYSDDGFYSRRFSEEALRGFFNKLELRCKIIKICPVNYIVYVKK